MRILALVIALGACGGTKVIAGPPPAPADAAASFDDRLAKVAEFRNRMCACTDGVCAELVTKDLDDWQRSLANLGRSASDEELHRSTPIATEMLECLSRAMGVTPAP